MPCCPFQRFHGENHRPHHNHSQNEKTDLRSVYASQTGVSGQTVQAGGNDGVHPVGCLYGRQGKRRKPAYRTIAECLQCFDLHPSTYNAAQNTDATMKPTTNPCGKKRISEKKFRLIFREARSIATTEITACPTHVLIKMVGIQPSGIRLSNRRLRANAIANIAAPNVDDVVSNNGRAHILS